MNVFVLCLSSRAPLPGPIIWSLAPFWLGLGLDRPSVPTVLEPAQSLGKELRGEVVFWRGEVVSDSVKGGEEEG